LKYYSPPLLALILTLGTLTDACAQPCVKIRNLCDAAGAGYVIKSGSAGAAEWVLDTNTVIDVNLTPIGYVPSATGNGSNLNEIVIDPNAEIWAIDQEGDAIQLSSTADGSETSVTAGSNVTVSGTGTSGDPYVISSSASGGTTVSDYSTGTGAHVWATGFGVTYAKNATTGEYTFTIPEDVILYRAVVDADVADDDGNGEIFAAFNYDGTRTFNSSLTNAWRPRVTVWESGGSAPSRSSPKNMLPVNVQGISSVGSGDIEIVLNNVSTITPNPVIEFNFF